MTSHPMLQRRDLLATASLPCLAVTVGGAPAFESAIMQSEFVDPASYPQCHASTMVELADGTLAAAWFSGQDEGSADVSI